jgi:hypothetical protein
MPHWSASRRKASIALHAVKIGDRMACVIEVEFGVWHEEEPKE